MGKWTAQAQQILSSTTLYLELAEKSLIDAEFVIPRWHALLEISRGQAFCDAGDITTAMDLIHKGFILAYQCHSPHQMNRVRTFLKKLENGLFHNHPKVRDLKNLLYETYAPPAQQIQYRFFMIQSDILLPKLFRGGLY